MTDREAAPAAGATDDRARSLLTAIAASSNDAIVAKDLTGTITFWNQAAEALFGFSAAEMLGAPITRIIPPARLEEEAFILAEIRRGERLSHFETERLTRDGRIIPVSVTVSPVLDEAGHIVGASKIARSLSEAHRTRDQLRHREALLQSILDTVPDGLIVIDRQGIIQFLSQAAGRMFGFEPAAVAGQNISRLMPPADAMAHDSYIGRYLASGVPRILGIGRAVAGQRKDGSTFPMELQIGEVRLPNIHLFTGFVRDLTERQDRERRVADLQAELIHVSRVAELGQMVAVLAHEVNQPLTAIANYARGLLRMMPADTPPALPGVVEKIGAQAERARTIVESLRELVRKEPRSRAIGDLRALIGETAALVLIGSGRSVNLSLRIAPDAAYALIDKVQIQQVLLNLMRNGVEAMAGAAIKALTISTARQGDRVALRVADRGPGLPEAVRARLFQAFVTTKAEGLGIGLSICRTIVQAHGGELVLEATSDHGTTFCLTLPAVEAEQFRESASLSAPADMDQGRGEIPVQ